MAKQIVNSIHIVALVLVAVPAAAVIVGYGAAARLAVVTNPPQHRIP